MRIQEVIRRPLITEKSAQQRESSNVVAFEVDRRANKIEIKRAVEAQFKGTKVTDVRVAMMHGKVRRQGRHSGRRPDWKKAYIRLAADSKPIDFFEGV
jgi:large subunit ribosomal protein L23